MRLQPPMPPRAAIIIGDDAIRAQARAACREAGVALDGAAATGGAGLALLNSLAAPPELLIVDLRFTDMDGADLIVALSALEPGPGLVICGADCARIQDTALVLAATLGLRVCASQAGALTVETLRAALGEADPGSGQSSGESARPGSGRRTGAVAGASPAARKAIAALPEVDAVGIRHGLLRDEFELYYQPKVAMADCRLLATEALLRWNHPRHGLLAPASFLPEAEAAGLTDLLTSKVMAMALADTQTWRAAGLRLPVSVNLSPVALTNPHLADQLAGTVARAGLPPSAIAFEITEHAEIADLGVALRVLLKLRLKGHVLSLDDYGAGYASILQMSRIPFREIKLDQRLVHNAWKRPHLRPLLCQAIAAARHLGATSVAEGVETRQDWDFMRGLGCDQAQGYLIARPMPAAKLLEWQPCGAAPLVA